MALLTVLAVAAAGCGSSADVKAGNAYVDAVNKAQTSFAGTVDRLSGHITATSSSARDRKTLAGFTSAVDRVVADLRAVKPPEKVAALHGRLVSAIDRYGTELSRTAGALRSKDPDVVVNARAALLKAKTTVTAQLDSTINAINNKLHA